MESIEGNKIIAEFMETPPEIEYCVATEDSICYSPKQVDNYFPYWQVQKKECERWLKEQNEKYPDGWVTKGGYGVKKYEWFPFYDKSWDALMPVVEKINSISVGDMWFRFRIEPTQAYISFYAHGGMSVPMREPSIFVGGKEKMMEAIYECVIQFIQWFNNTKQK